MTKFGSVKDPKTYSNMLTGGTVHVVYTLTCPTMTVDGFYSDAHY